jgi:pilus assembly protein Flp/PilA
MELFGQISEECLDKCSEFICGREKMLESITRKYVDAINAIVSFKVNKNGQTLVEYALLLVLIAMVVIAAVTFIGQTTNNSYCKVGGVLS